VLRLSTKAAQLVELLDAVGLAFNRQHRRERATHATVFIPQKAMALALEVDTSTIRRWFGRYPQLRRRVAARRHYGSIGARGGKRTVIDGMLWTVRFTDSGGEVRVPIEDLRHQGYRNLDADIAAGRTLHESTLPTWVVSMEEKVKYLLGWAFGAPDLTPVGSTDAGSVYDTEPERLAVAIATELDDRHSLRFWIRECGKWARRGKIEGLGAAVQRILADRKDEFARRPAALLVSRLRPRGSAAGVTARSG
jgi:hypothetical protein